MQIIMEFGYRGCRDHSAEFLAGGFGDIDNCPGAIEEVGYIVFFFLEAKESPRARVFDYEILDAILDLPRKY